MEKPAPPIPAAYMLAGVSCSSEKGMEVLTLTLAQGPDHLAAVNAGQHPGIVIRVVLHQRQSLDLANLLRREFDIPKHRPN